MVFSMNFISFDDDEELGNFLKGIPHEKLENAEYGILKNFNKNRILFTAEHAYTSRVKTPQYGKGSYVEMGDSNTDVLAILMAERLKSAFLISRLSRVEADPSRPISTLGKDEKILIEVFNSKVKNKKHFRIHRNKDYAPFLKKYHSMIEKLNPSAIVCVHGMSERGHPSDILFGLGENYRMIGGKKNALKFKNLYIKRVNEVFSRFNIEDKLKINISKWLFTGEKNYALFKHVIQHNKTTERKRFGIQVEFNARGRISKGNFIRKDYQIATQVLADTVLEWLKDYWNE